MKGLHIINADNIVTNEGFEDDIDFLFYLEGHNYDFQLLQILGAEIIEDDEGNHYFYFVHDDSNIDSIDENMLKLRIYYQLKNDSYDDKNLEKVIDSLGGVEYIKYLVNEHRDYKNIYKELTEIFNSKKGNVIQFNFKKQRELL